jgi:hypothetical protein
VAAALAPGGHRGKVAEWPHRLERQPLQFTGLPFSRYQVRSGDASVLKGGAGLGDIQSDCRTTSARPPGPSGNPRRESRHPSAHSSGVPGGSRAAQRRTASGRRQQRHTTGSRSYSRAGCVGDSCRLTASKAGRRRCATRQVVDPIALRRTHGRSAVISPTCLLGADQAGHVEAVRSSRFAAFKRLARDGG